MEREVEYTLKRLDEWNYRRANLLKRADEKILRKVKDSLKEIGKMGSLDELNEEEKLQISNIFSLEGIIEMNRDALSKNYGFIESILNQNFPELYKNIPEGVRNEYFQPSFEEFRQYKSFVDDVRAKSANSFPDELSDKDIDECFKNSFKKTRDYSNHLTRLIDLSLIQMDLDPNLDISDKKKLRKFYSSMRGLIPLIVEIVYGDLYSS